VGVGLLLRSAGDLEAGLDLPLISFGVEPEAAGGSGKGRLMINGAAGNGSWWGCSRTTAGMREPSSAAVAQQSSSARTPNGRCVELCRISTKQYAPWPPPLFSHN
jgi:hypothetical protein